MATRSSFLSTATKIKHDNSVFRMNLRRTLLLTIFTTFLFSIVSADTYATQTNALLTHSPLGLLIPLGIENFVPAADAIMYYNYIGVFLLVGLASFSGMSNESRFLIMVPFAAAALIFIGWLQAPNPTSYWGMIVALILFGCILFVNDMGREKYGSGGPGTKVISIAVMIIVFEASVVLMADPNFSPFPSELDTSGSGTATQLCHGYGYTCDANGNVDLSASVSSVTASGGTTLDVVSIITWTATLVVSMAKFIITLLAAVFLFSAVLTAAYPVLATSPQALLVLGIMQIVIWIVYLVAWFNWSFKPNYESTGV
jgi:hypothetical protein